MNDPAPTPETPSPVSVRSHIRRGLALVSLAIASLAAIAGTVVLAQAVYYDAVMIVGLATDATVTPSADELETFLLWISIAFIVGALLVVTAMLWTAVPVWLGGLWMFGGLVLDVAGQRTASATTMLGCAACNGLGALLFFVWHHFSSSATTYVLPAGIANAVAAVVCLVVVGLAHARGTEAG